MRFDEHLDAIRREAPALRRAATDAGPAAPVVACPGWSATDLVWHVAAVHHRFAMTVGERLPTREAYEPPARPEGDDAVWRVAEEAEALLLDVLGRTDPATPVPTWTGRRDVAWVARRVASETAVHRVDAERAAGRDHRLDAPLASDGVDEYLEVFLPRLVEGAAPLDGTVHLHCTDVAGEWLVEVGEDGAYAVRREHVKGDVALRGAAHDLDMVLWRRAPLESVDIVGDRPVAERLLARTQPR